MAGPCLTDGLTVALDQLDDGSLTAEVQASSNQFNALLGDTAGGGLLVLGAPIVQVLPSTSGLIDGTTVRFQPDPSGNPDRLWRLVFNAATGKWDWDGGSPLRDMVVGASTRGYLGGGSWGHALDTSGPSIQLPSGIPTGLYNLKYGLKAKTPNATGEFYYSPKYSASEATTANAAQNNGATMASVMSEAELIIAAGQLVDMRYRNDDSGGTGLASVERRWLELHPISIG